MSNFLCPDIRLAFLGDFQGISQFNYLSIVETYDKIKIFSFLAPTCPGPAVSILEFHVP